MPDPANDDDAATQPLEAAQLRALVDAELHAAKVERRTTAEIETTDLSTLRDLSRDSDGDAASDDDDGIPIDVDDLA